MRKVLTIILAVVMSISLCACGSSASTTEKSDMSAGGSSLPNNIQMYSSGTTVKTNFGEITVIDAAFCGKAQLIDALPQPTYNSAKEGLIVFAMRTLISNTTDKDLVLMDDLKVSIQYGKDNSFGCSKGGNYKSSDPLYKTLPAGASGEYIICGKVPVEVYQSNDQFYVDFNGEKLGFSNNEVQLYNSMGYQDGDNTTVSIEEVITAAGTASEDGNESSSKTEEATQHISFTLEDARYEEKSSYFAIEVKIRNNSDVSLIWPAFNGVILDANGDILENCMCSYTNGLEAGQAGWTVIRISEQSTLEEMDSIKIDIMWDKETTQSASHNLRFDLSEPLIINIHELEPKK